MTGTGERGRARGREQTREETASEESLRRIVRLVDAYASGDRKRAPVEELEEQFWRALAKAGGNRIFVIEVSWWYDVLRERPLPRQVTALPRKTRLAFYIELARRLLAHERPVEFYMETVGPILDALFARRE